MGPFGAPQEFHFKFLFYRSIPKGKVTLKLINQDRKIFASFGGVYF